MKWWSEIDEQGNETWRFESLFKCKTEGLSPAKANPCDSFFFWSTVYGTALFWLIWSFIKLVALDAFFLTLSFIGFILAFSNVVGYYKCERDH